MLSRSGARILSLGDQLAAGAIPLLASPQGGVAERSKNIAKPPLSARPGVVFRLRTKRKTTPAASVSVASRHFPNDAATPPCGDARRGMYRSHTFDIFSQFRRARLPRSRHIHAAGRTR